MDVRALGVLAAGVLVASSAFAAQVTVSGGFTSFQGPGAQSPATLSVHVNSGSGAQNYAPTSDADNDGYGLGAKLTFGPVATLTFGCTTLSGYDACAAGDNAFTFVGAGPQEVAGTGSGNQFLLGQLIITDGSWFPNFSDGTTLLATAIGLRLTTNSSDAAFDNQVLDAILSFESIFPNGGDRVCFSGVTVDASANCQTVPNSLSAAAQVSRTFNLYGYINSLHLSAVQPVPEPGSLALLGLGLVGLGLSRRGRKT